MHLTVSSAVTEALPTLAESAPSIDLRELQEDLEAVARDALAARDRGIPLIDAVESAEYPSLRTFHHGLRDALFVEIPRELDPWVDAITTGDSRQGSALVGLQQMIVALAQGETIEPPGAPTPAEAEGLPEPAESAAMQQILAELLIFEAIRLQLLITALGGGGYEELGGEESDIDAIAWAEVEALLHHPDLRDPEIRPLHVLRATASVALARDAHERVELLRQASPDLRDQIRMRARLRAALRTLRLPEAVLLENALASLLGEERRELQDLQTERPVALDGLSRQAMDQRVSRGRRALARTEHHWPRRRRPALFDLLRSRENPA